MDCGPKGIGKVLYCLFGLLAVIQIAGIGLLIYFAGKSLNNERTLLDRSTIMMENTFPAMRRDLSVISHKASEIHEDLSDLRVQVSDVHALNRDIAEDTSNLNRQVDTLNKGLTGFFRDASVLVRSYALTPYILIFFAIVICSIPISIWVFGRRNQSRCPEQCDAFTRLCAGITAKLDSLSISIEKALAANGNSSFDSRKLIVETEKLIQEARAELASLSQTALCCAEHEDKISDKLN